MRSKRFVCLRRTGHRGYVDQQRIRLTGLSTAANEDVRGFIAGIMACPAGDTAVSVTESPRYPNYFRIVGGPGNDHLVSWVAVRLDEHAPGGLSTILLAEGPGRVDGFAELDRLVALAVHHVTP